MCAARTILTVSLVVEDQAIGVCHAINNAAGRSQTVHASGRRLASDPSVRWRDEVQVTQARLYRAV